MNPELFVNYPIIERQRLLREDGNPDYVYCILGKHLKKSIPQLKEKYTIEYSIPQGEIIITGGTVEMFELFNYFSFYGLQIKNIQPTKFIIDANYFLSIIY
jgi:hypothetical protein